MFPFHTMLFQRRDKCEKPRFKNFAALDLFWDVSLAQPELLLTKVLQSLRDRKSEKTAYRKALQHYLESMETEIIVDISYLQSMHHSFTVVIHEVLVLVWPMHVRVQDAVLVKHVRQHAKIQLADLQVESLAM